MSPTRNEGHPAPRNYPGHPPARRKLATPSDCLRPIHLVPFCPVLSTRQVPECRRYNVDLFYNSRSPYFRYRYLRRPYSGRTPALLRGESISCSRWNGPRRIKALHIGLSTTTYKVLTQETGGALFVVEHSNKKKGGPPRHLHHDIDELFYSLEGDYIVEVGSQRFHLKTGDCVLGPREVPHVWAFAGDSPGKLLISFAPAGKMEAFFNEREKLGIKPGEYAKPGTDAALLRAFGMELVGPPLVVE